MAKFRFIGTEDGPTSIKFMNQVDFVKGGSAVDVSKFEPRIEYKLSISSQFEEVKSRPKKKAVEQKETVIEDAEIVATNE